MKKLASEKANNCGRQEAHPSADSVDLHRVARPDGKHDRQIWDAATVATEKYPEIAWRYEPEQVRLSVAQSIRQWWNALKNLEWNWSRTGLVMRPIKPGEPGYDGAPYEMAVVWHRDVMRSSENKIRHERSELPESQS